MMRIVKKIILQLNSNHEKPAPHDSFFKYIAYIQPMPTPPCCPRGGEIEVFLYLFCDKENHAKHGAG